MKTPGTIAMLLVLAVSGCSRDGKLAREASADGGQATAEQPAAPETPQRPAPAVASVVPDQGARTGQPAAPSAAPAIAAPAVAGTVPPAASSGEPVIPEISLAPRPGHSFLEGRPDYKPLDDPERDAVARGRRLVEEIATPFTGGAESADGLSRAILSAIGNNDLKGLHQLRLTRDEFEEILWPEFPESRPVTNIKAWDAWFLMDGECHDGASELISSEGGNELTFDATEYRVGVRRYSRFNLYEGIVIRAHRPDGEVVRLDHAWIYAERHGQWKVYMYDDKQHPEAND